MRQPVAVIGIGCRLPGGIGSAVAYWDALLCGLNAIRDVPDDRNFRDTDELDFIRNAKGGFIDGVDQFDADFFGYVPREAQRMDPQQRLLLEVTHEAMEDAGLRRDQLDGSRTSVFIGAFRCDYLYNVGVDAGVTSLADRIAGDFNLKGRNSWKKSA
jgi:acyl transferase domain-containing protein